jgi:hypothetical protein
VHQWLGTFRVAQAEFESDRLANVNTPGDLMACQENPRRVAAWRAAPAAI